MRKCLMVLCLLVGGCDACRVLDAKAAALCERQGTRLYKTNYVEYPNKTWITCTNGRVLQVPLDELRAVVGQDVENFLLNKNISYYGHK